MFLQPTRILFLGATPEVQKLDAEQPPPFRGHSRNSSPAQLGALTAVRDSLIQISHSEPIVALLLDSSGQWVQPKAVKDIAAILR
jgi:hypothetical protein